MYVYVSCDDGDFDYDDDDGGYDDDVRAVCGRKDASREPLRLGPQDGP